MGDAIHEEIAKGSLQKFWERPGCADAQYDRIDVETVNEY